MINVTCKNCGGDVTVLSQNGTTVTVKCTCCGSVFEKDLAPKPSAAKSAPRQTSTEMAGEDIYDRNIKAVAEISTESGLASGYVVAGCGVIVTNTHAVTKNGGTPCTDISVKVNGRSYKAELIALGDRQGGHGDGVDLALIVARGGRFNSVKLGSSSAVRNGENVYYIGNSQGEGTCITGGIVSDRDRILGDKHVVMTDAATNPGNSGGPLINRNGEVIGTHMSARNNAVGMKYAVPVDTVKAFIAAVSVKSGLSELLLCDSSVSGGNRSDVNVDRIQLFNEGIMYVKYGK